MRELIEALCDWRECGDLLGHLRAWWRTVTGRVSLDERPGLSATARAVMTWWSVFGYNPEEASSND